MLALTLSDFYPTVRFGYMMAAMMLAALVGDLVLLPCLLCLLGRKPKAQQTVPRGPHFSPTANRRDNTLGQTPHADPRRRPHRIGLGLTID